MSHNRGMDAWIIWLVAACALGIGEMHQGGFYLAPFALGALIAVIVSLSGVGFALSAVGFIAGSGLVFATLRPIANSHRRTPPQIRTGAAALIGKQRDRARADRQPRGCRLREDRRRGVDRAQLRRGQR